MLAGFRRPGLCLWPCGFKPMACSLPGALGNGQAPREAAESLWPQGPGSPPVLCGSMQPCTLRRALWERFHLAVQHPLLGIFLALKISCPLGCIACCRNAGCAPQLVGGGGWLCSCGRFPLCLFLWLCVCSVVTVLFMGRRCTDRTGQDRCPCSYSLLSCTSGSLPLPLHGGSPLRQTSGP